MGKLGFCIIPKYVVDKLDSVQKRTGDLESELETSNRTNEELRGKLDELKLQKQALITEQKAVESRYKDKLAQRDTVIQGLKVNVEDLRRSIDEKQVIITEQEKIIESYESSFRAVAKLSLKVTGGKLKKAGGSLKRLIQNDPPEELD